MLNFIVFVILVSWFGSDGFFLWILFILFKSYWPLIQERLRKRKRFRSAIDIDMKPKTNPFSPFRSFLPSHFPTMNSLSIKSILKGLALLFVAFMLFDGFTSIPAGHVGVVYDRGRGVLSEAFGEGLHLKIPFWQVVEKMNARTLEYTMSVAPGENNRYGNDSIYGDDSMSAPTADGQTVTVDATVLFHIDKTQAAKLFQTVGPFYVDTIVRPVARSQIRMVISRYTATEIYTEKRANAEEAMNTDITKIFGEKGIVLERVLLRNVTFSPQYAAAIEEKQIAQQRIQKADYERQEAEKLKQKKIVEAEGDAQAIRLKGETLRSNPQVIQYEFVQKMSPNISWGVLPDNILPLVDLKKLSGGKE